MTALTTEITTEISRALDTIGDPCSVANGTPMGLHEMGLIERIDVDDDGNVEIDLRLTSPTCMMIGYFKVEVQRRVSAIDGVRSVAIKADRGLDWTHDMMSAAAKERRSAHLQALSMR